MLLFSTPIVLAALALILALHALVAVLPELASKILSYVNIGLHIVLIFPLIYYKFSFEEAVLVYMISLTFNTFLAFLRYRLSVRRRARNIAFFEKYKPEEEKEV